MILMKLKIDNYMAFNDFEMNMSYPKKIVGNHMIEYLERFPNYRYRKLNILMGANASGKTSIGRMLMIIFNFVDRKEYTSVISHINVPEKDAFFEVQFVVEDTFYRINSLVRANMERNYTSDSFRTKVESIKINKNDSYESCLERLDKKSDGLYSSDYIRELEKIDKLSWAFEFPRDSMRATSSFIPQDDKKYVCILKNTLQALDPLILDVEKINESDDVYMIKLANERLLIKNGQIVGDDILSSGTKEGISLANMYSALVCGDYTFFYCDEKFSYINSDVEKAFLSLMVQRLEGDRQLFFTTHNTDILDMDFPKHSYNFIRKTMYGDECYISVENAGDYVKKNSESVRNAVENDLFSSAPMLEKIFALNEV